MKLKEGTWQQVVNTLFYLYIDKSNCIELDGESMEIMIDHYFNKEYQEGCNYCITHFNNPDIKKINFYESAYY